MTKPQLTMNRYLPIFFFYIIIIGIIVSFQLNADFDTKDDHRILAFSSLGSSLHNQIAPRENGFWHNFISLNVSDFNEVGRFRPVTHVLEIGIPSVLGTNPKSWRVCWILLGIFSATLFFILGTQLFRSQLAVLAFSAIPILAPDPGPLTVWYRFGHRAELFGFILVVSGLLALMQIKKNKGAIHEVLALFFFTLAALTKESFILLLPALLIFRNWQYMTKNDLNLKESLNQYKTINLLYLTIFTVAITFTLLALTGSPSQSYGAESLTVSISSIRQVLYQNITFSFLINIWFIPILVWFYLAFSDDNFSFKNKYFVTIIVTFIAWFFPQLILHATRGGMWDHYWMPCILGFAFITGFAIESSAKNYGRIYTFSIAAILAIWAINGLRTNIPAIQNYTAKNNAHQAAIRTVAKHLSTQENVVIVADSRQNSERAFSLVYYLGLYGRRDSIIYYYDSSANHNAESIPRSPFVKNSFFPDTPDLDQLPSTCVSAIIFLDQPSGQAWEKWYDKSHFSRMNNPYYSHFFSIKNFAKVQVPSEFDYSLSRSKVDGDKCKMSRNQNVMSL